MMKNARRVGMLLALAALAACRPADPPTESVDVQAGARARETYPPIVVAQIDSGNAAYSAGNYEEALRHYRAAADAGPEIPATWFGIYMAQHALGNLAAADSALQRVRTVAPGASLLRPGSPDSTRR
jgi:tetratricopeptide (TPR) repeat protein